MRLSQRSLRTVVSVSVLAGATAVAFQLSTGSAAADTATLLPITSAADLVVDGDHRRIFISDPTGGRILTTDYAGNVLATTSGLPGVRDLLLTDRLYAAVPDAGTIVEFDPATTGRTGTFETGGAPRTLATAAGKIWFGEDGRQLGSLDLSGEQPVVTRGESYGANSWSHAPLLAATPAKPNLVAAVDTGASGGRVSLLDVSTTPPTRIAERAVGDRGMGLQFSPDGSRLIATGVQSTITALSSADLSPVESYKATDAFPAGVAVRADGVIAIRAKSSDKGAVALYTPGVTDAVKELDLRQALDASGAPISLSLTTPSSAMAWEPGGVRLFGLGVKTSTSASKPDPIFTLQILNDPAKTAVSVQIDAPSHAKVGDTYTVAGIVSRPVPVGLPLVITRTDAEHPDGVRVGPQTVPDYGSFEFQEVQSQVGPVTYTISFAGDDEYTAAADTATVQIAASRPTSLTIDRHKTTWAYGTTLSFTAKLGPTHTNRVVELWADPDGNDQPNRLLKRATVDAKGQISASFKLTRNTVVEAVFTGDALSEPQYAHAYALAKASISTKVTRHYKTRKIGSQKYFVFRKTKHPRFTTTINPYPGRDQFFQIDVLRNGKWLRWGQAYYPLNSAGVSVKDLKGTHSTGLRYRMRSSYIYNLSGDLANATTNGPYVYFTFTK